MPAIYTPISIQLWPNALAYTSSIQPEPLSSTQLTTWPNKFTSPPDSNPISTILLAKKLRRLILSSSMSMSTNIWGMLITLSRKLRRKKLKGLKKLRELKKEKMDNRRSKKNNLKKIKKNLKRKRKKAPLKLMPNTWSERSFQSWMALSSKWIPSGRRTQSDLLLYIAWRTSGESNDKYMMNNCPLKLSILSLFF